MVGMMRVILGAAASAVVAATALAQTPQPFPRPGSASPPPGTQPAPQSPPPAAAAAPIDPAAPTAATLGVAVYPTAQFIASYDAGRGQRYYVFGVGAPFTDLVSYYRSILKERGDQVFTQPPTHVFEIGRFREDTMAFPPGVTVKDWTWGGSAGYPNPRPEAQPARFPTIVVIVPPPPAAR